MTKKKHFLLEYLIVLIRNGNENYREKKSILNVLNSYILNIGY